MQAKDNADTARPNAGESLRYSYSEQYRRECEARMVLAWPLLKRRKYLLSVEDARGKDGREYLEAEMIRQWNLKKANA